MFPLIFRSESLNSTTLLATNIDQHEGWYSKLMLCNTPITLPIGLTNIFIAHSFNSGSVTVLMSANLELALTKLIIEIVLSEFMALTHTQAPYAFQLAASVVVLYVGVEFYRTGVSEFSTVPMKANHL